MMSWHRSISTSAAMSTACTRTANITVTCLRSTTSPEAPVDAPRSSQNVAFPRRPVPHDPHATPDVIPLFLLRGLLREHRLGPGHMSVEAKRFRHLAIALH